YVNDAFGTAHRAHASTTVVAKFFSQEKKCFGYLMAKEVENLRKILNNPEKPFTAIIGGAKVSDKIKVLQALLKVADNIIIGGAMAFTFIKAKGGMIGKSLCEHECIDIALNFLEEAEVRNAKEIRNIKIYLPVDAVCAKEFADTSEKNIFDSSAIPEEWMGLDIGPKSITIFRDIIASSKSILWNGPMGVFEFTNFEEGTKQVALIVAETTEKNKAFSVVGGGDSVAAIHKFRLDNQISFISTGGGAMLEFIENGTLPGIEAMEK
ncbi:MAG: phosphoglycerate kinase, partial [Bacteroidetes bacterium]